VLTAALTAETGS